MKTDKEFIIYCHFSAVAKKTINATNSEEAKRIAESDDSINFDEIIRITYPCIVDQVVETESDNEFSSHRNYEYKSWGSE